MAYANSNLTLIAQCIGDTAPNIWIYQSADAYTAVKASGYFSDSATNGMKVGDLIYVYDTGTPAYTLAVVTSITAGASTLSATGVAIS